MTRRWLQRSPVGRVLVAAALALGVGATVAAGADEPPAESATAREGYEQRIKIERRRIVLGERIYFEHGRGRILPVSFPILDALADRLKPAPQIELIQIEGHTDSVGSREVNQRLSAFRARAVRDYLISKGVPPARLVAKGFGEEWPKASNLMPEGRERNRRVELVILEVQKRHVWRRRPATRDYAVAIRASLGTEERGPEGASAPLSPGQPLYTGDTVETAEGSGAILRFPGIVLAQVARGSALRLEAIRGDSSGDGRFAQVRLLRGSVALRAYLPLEREGAKVRVEAGGAVITFAHSEVRIIRESGGARVEVLAGEALVQLGTAQAKVVAGQGVRVDTVAATLAPATLPAAPAGRKPRHGAVEELVLSWDTVPGASSYVVELARDVDFLDLVSQQEVEGTVLRHGFGAGVYYWRVRTRAQNGFESVPWPILQFTKK